MARINLYMLIFKDMKKFLSKSFIFVILLVVIDNLIGHAFSSIHDKHFLNEKTSYIANKSTDEVLVFGSSRANRHYNASMIEDSLGMTCFNCGDDGMGIMLAYARLLMCKERKTPKLILYDFQHSFDIYENDDSKCFTYLKLWKDRPYVSEIISAIDSKEQVKLLSKMYMYNSSMLSYLKTYLLGLHINSIENKGFFPVFGNIDSLNLMKKENKVKVKPQTLNVDPLKREYLLRFIDECKDSKLVFIVSPTFSGLDEEVLEPIKQICAERHIIFLNFANCPKYLYQCKYFKDEGHLNSVGADEYTKDMLKILKKKVSIN